MIKRILLALGGTPFSPVALRYALELAQAHAAGLTALPLLDPHAGHGPISSFASAGEVARQTEHQPWQQYRRRLDEITKRFRSECEATGIAHRVAEPSDDPFHQLADLSRYHDLIVFGLRGVLDYGLVPEPERTVAGLIRAGVRPVLAVPPKHRPVRRALIAYSGSAESANAMKQFVQMRPWPKASLKIACCGRDQEEAGALLADARGYCKAHGLSPESEHLTTSPAQGLLELADRGGADLIALGNSSRSVFVQDVLGSTFLSVLQRSSVPLFLSN